LNTIIQQIAPNVLVNGGLVRTGDIALGLQPVRSTWA